MAKIYTKTGDDGSTSLMGGRRLSKADAQVEVYGNLDELNAFLGKLLVYEEIKQLRQWTLIRNIQHNLFKIGGLFSYDLRSAEPYPYAFLQAGDVESLENAIDELSANLPPLKNFVVPGGNAANADAHIARCVCRRAERYMVAFLQHHTPAAVENKEYALTGLRYLNRLSDYLFVLSRGVYQEEVEQVSF